MCGLAQGRVFVEAATSSRESSVEFDLVIRPMVSDTVLPVHQAWLGKFE